MLFLERVYKSFLNIKIKKLHPDAVVPSYAKSGDAGMDLTAVSMSVDDYGNIVYRTGLAFEIPERYVGLLFMRSSIFKTDLILTNAVGVIDSGYRGEVMLKFKRIKKQEYPDIYSPKELFRTAKVSLVFLCSIQTE